MTNRAFHLGLAALATLLLCKGIVWAVTLPPFDGPDEASHFAYAQLLALRGELPTQSPVLNEGPDVRALEDAALAPSVAGIPPQARYYPERLGPGQVGPWDSLANSHRADPGPLNPAGAYGPVTYSLFALALNLVAPSVVSEIMAARLVSIILGVLAGLAAVWLAREAGLGRRLAIAAAVVVGLQPMWSQQTAMVTTDAGLLFFGTLYVAALLHWLRDQRSRWALVATVALVAGLFSKSSMLAALPLLLVLGIPVMDRARAARDRLRAAAVAVACWVTATLPYALWLRAHPGFAPSGAAKRSVMSYVQHALIDDPNYFRNVLANFWGGFGWIEQGLPLKVQYGLFLLTLVGLLLAGLGVVGNRRHRRTGTWVMTVFFALTVALPVAFDVQTWRVDGALSLQGRYWLPALPVAVTLALLGISTLVRRRFEWVVASLMATGALLLNMLALGVLWQRYFVG